MAQLQAMKPRPATEAPPAAEPAPPLIAATSNAKVNAVVDVVNNVAAPFQNPPDPARGTLGAIEHGIGAVMGVVGAPFELLDTGFAMLTSPLAALVPGMPAATIMAPHLGTPHTHTHPLSLTPPNPVPVPLPSIGAVMLSGSASVLISGAPAARAADVGIAPLCFGFTPAFEVYTGSSNTWISGSRAARLADITMHCNPASAMNAIGLAMGAIGVAAGAISAGASANAGDMANAATQKKQALADAAALAMSALLGKDPGIPPTMGALMQGAPTVLIGGFPMPDVLALLGGLAKLLKKGLGSKAFGKLLNKVGLCNSPTEPVHPITGEVYNEWDDYEAPDGEFRWSRYYTSRWNEENGPLGRGHRHGFERRLTLLRKRAMYASYDGELIAFERIGEWSYAATAGFELSSPDGDHFELLTERDELLSFRRLPTTPPSGRLERYKTATLDVRLEYDVHDRLRRLVDSTPSGITNETTLVYDAGHITEVHRGRLDQVLRVVIARYRYADDCLSEVEDILGARATFRYDSAHRMARATGPNGYSFHWRYDLQSGRCIESHGDDGLWGIEADYRGTQTVFKEPDGGEWIFKQSPDGTISHVVDPYLGALAYVQDDTGRVIGQTLPGGTQYTWLYDERGRHYARLDPFGNLVPPEEEEPDPDPLAHDGPETQAEWRLGRPLATLPPAPRGIPPPVSAKLDALRRLHDIAGKPIETRDGLGRIVEERAPDGSVRRFAYDGENNLVAEDTRAAEPAAQSRRTTYTYGSWNLLAAETTPLGNTTRYEYTHREEWRALVDANGNRTDYVRDLRHRIIEINRTGGPQRRYLYDAHDAIVEELDEHGNTLVRHETGPHGLYVASELASGEKYTYAYDEDGQFTRASSSQHDVEQRHVYGKLSLDVRDGKGVRHLYDTDDEDLRLLHTAALDRFGIAYEYRADGAVAITTPDGAEHLLRRSEDHVVFQYGSGTSEALVFDAQGRQLSQSCWRRDRVLEPPFWTVSYEYDAAGDLSRTTDGERARDRYEYDADRRLVVHHDALGRERRYGHDPAGNLTQTPQHGFIKYGPGNAIEHADFDLHAHDARCRRCRVDRPGRDVTEYVYDSLDQLIEVRFSNRAEVWRAGYDGLGRRIWRDFAGARTDFYWDDDRLAAERSPDGQLRIYVYANEDALVPFMWVDYERDDSDPASGKAFYLFTAPTGMPLRVEDAYGRDVWRAETVDAYGELHGALNRPCPTRLRFAGHFHDEHLGLFYNRFRDYDPTLGQYLQPDPIGHEGGINLFAYAGNPLVEVDLRGLVVPHRRGKPRKAKSRQRGKGRPKGERGGKRSKGRRSNRPGVKRGQVDSYDGLNKKAKTRDGMDHDHIPAFASVRDAINAQLAKKGKGPLSEKQEARLKKNLTAMAIDHDVHKVGRTYGGRGGQERLDADASNLRKAASDDLDAHKKNVPKGEKGNVDNWADNVHARNEEIGLYKKPIPDSLWK